MNQNENLIDIIIEGIQEKKGKSITHVDLSALDVATAQNFVICTGGSPAQVSAIADSVSEFMKKKAGIRPYFYDGYQNAQWIVIDYGTIYVHVFLNEWREFYNLEQLWNDAVITEVPDLD